MRISRWIGLLLGLVLSLAGLFAAPSASAATGYTLTADPGTGVTTSASAITLTVSYLHNGAKVARATARLQYLKGSTWTTEKEVTIRKGKGSTRVKHAVGERTYRFSVSGKAVSEEFTVRFVPATFTLKGSGFGHGVGMSQWGAYQMAREGFSTVDIVSYYYPGATVDSANNNARTVKVQVLGPPADSRTSTTLKVTSGGFTLAGDGVVLKSSGTPGTVAIGVSGTTVTAKVTLANGTVKNKVLPASSRLTLTWTRGPVTVAGAHGSYSAGNLQVTVIGGRPNVVNELAMNTDYLYGIDEMPSSWGSASGKGQAALQAQAIVARNYIITAAIRANPLPGGVRADCDCQVFDDTRSQNFVGAKKSSGSANKPWIDAVNATILSGSLVQVVRDPSAQIAETPYFASSGSFTAEGTGYSGTAGNQDVFGSTALSYLSHVADPYSARASGNPNLRWTRTISQAKAQKLFGATQLLTSVQVTSRYAGGLAQTVTVTTADGGVSSYTMTADQWRAAFGLPGAWVASITAK